MADSCAACRRARSSKRQHRTVYVHLVKGATLEKPVGSLARSGWLTCGTHWKTLAILIGYIICLPVGELNMKLLHAVMKTRKDHVNLGQSVNPAVYLI